MAVALASTFLLALSPADVRIAFMPLDDRPATERFPKEIASICGAHLELPPQELLGHFTRPGDPAGLGRWLLGLDAHSLNAVVISSDMLAYGGLVASRTDRIPLGDASFHLRAIARFHESHPEIPIYVFGATMRLAPTRLPETESYFEALTTYAQLAGVAHPSEQQSAALAAARSHIPDDAFRDYINARARDLEIAKQLVVLTAQGDIAFLALTQDDAGTDTGLQVPEQAWLHALIAALGIGHRVFQNPGTDEMGMTMVTRAVEDAVGWAPSIDVIYSSERGAAAQDANEYLPISRTIDNLTQALRMTRLGDADFSLFVQTPGTSTSESPAFLDRLQSSVRQGAPSALVDLSFLDRDLLGQHQAVDELRRRVLVADLAAYASWNTTANSTGTALAQAGCAAIARHFGLDTRTVNESFLFERYVDDYAFRLDVRPALNAEMLRQGVDPYALGQSTEQAQSLLRHDLWRRAVDIFRENFAQAGWVDQRLNLYLPWQRTFEVQVEATLARP
jgi:Protein of unknown function (DUF4127)